jgi:Fic family protein
VVAPIKEIQEVKNAIKTYEMYPSLDAFKEKDLLKAHSVMMQALVDDAGHYRHGGVGVYGEKGLVHLAPPADRVPMLMGDLFDWLKHSKDHLLIRSCVFHFEFEFIHPFIDGNGRMGRLWQSLILGKLHPLFEHLPVENMVYSNQQQYYDAITASTNAGQSGPFIDFMLNEIYKTLKSHQGEPLHDKLHDKVADKVADEVANKSAQKVMLLLNENGNLTREELAERTGLSLGGIKKIINSLRENGFIERVGSNKTGYWKVNI